MRMKIWMFLIVMITSLAAWGQSNTCAYTFTYTKFQFQFCLTIAGTLAMLQSPIGVDHLDVSNPVEGWYWNLDGYVHNGGDVYWYNEQIPAFGGNALGTPSVTQPNGPGTLPIRFDWGGMYEIVTAIPSQKSISLKVVVPPMNVWYGGNLNRMVIVKVDGTTANNFDYLRNQVFAYVEGGEEIGMQSSGFNCVLPAGAGLSYCSASNPAFTGYGSFVANTGYRPRTPFLTVTYKMF
jgi:hypothetical protein